MAANDLEYGWYKWKNGFRQKDGFFVDRAGRILYWPTRKGPGYVMDDAAVEAVVHQERVWRRRKYFAAILIMGLILSHHDLGRYFDIHIPYDIAIVAVFIMLAVVRVMGLRRRRRDLSHRPMVDERRPAVRDALVVANVLPSGEFWWRVAGQILLALLLITLGFYFFEATVASLSSEFRANQFTGQGVLWGSGLAGLHGLVWRVARSVKARFAPITAEEVRARILVADGQQDRSLWHEEDVERLPRPFHTNGKGDTWPSVPRAVRGRLNWWSRSRLT